LPSLIPNHIKQQEKEKENQNQNQEKEEEKENGNKKQTEINAETTTQEKQPTENELKNQKEMDSIMQKIKLQHAQNFSLVLPPGVRNMKKNKHKQNNKHE